MGLKVSVNMMRRKISAHACNRTPAIQPVTSKFTKPSYHTIIAKMMAIKLKLLELIV
jgi:hypothetical protein